jgi:CubicO group peptidase (beta-lactamase class C family)
MEDVYKFLSEYELTRDIGTQYEYSNLGVGLLGHALSLKAGANYETLVVKEICEPLKMKDTRITLTPRMKEHAATAHTGSGEPLPRWAQPSLVAAGSICSSANDMTKYISAELGLAPSSLLEAMQKTQEPRRKAMRNTQVGLGWHIRKLGDGEIVTHNGSTVGFHSFVGFDKQRRCGGVVLVNSANEIGDLPLKVLKLLQSNAKNGRIKGGGIH